MGNVRKAFLEKSQILKKEKEKKKHTSFRRQIFFSTQEHVAEGVLQQKLLLSIVPLVSSV